MAVAIDDNGKITEYVRNPDGSWTGWGNAVGAPIEVRVRGVGVRGVTAT